MNPYFELVKHPLKVRHVQVAQVRAVTPQMRRVTLTGPDLDGFVSLAPEDHIKLFFPAPGKDTPVVPVIGPLGVPLPLKGKPIARDYTVRRFDAERRELEVDFFLHAHGGPASSWATTASVGQALAMAGPRGSFVLSRQFDWQLFVGDETALPEIARRMEELPDSTQAIAVLAVNGAAEEQPLTGARTPEVHWIHRPTPTADLAHAYKEPLSRMLPARGNGFVWLAGEATEVRASYRHLIDTLDFDKQRVRASGHWKRGKANHDHHESVV